MEKCSKTKMCNALASRVEEVNAHKKGLVPICTINLKTGVSRFRGVAYKTTANDNGIMLNVCPFCCEAPGEVE